MRYLLVGLPMVLLAGCLEDESVARYGGAGVIWQLSEIDGQSFPARATLQFGEDGAISGEGPCNSYNGSQTAPYPWFRAEQIASTRRACPDVQQEAAFFDALAGMTLSEVSGDTLILSTEAGREMVFRPAD